MAIGEISKLTQRVRREAIVIQGLEVLVASEGNQSWTQTQIGYFKTLSDAGVTAINGTISHPSDELSDAVKKISKFYRALEGTESAKIALTVSDIESAKKEGKVGVIMGMQGSIPFERDLDLIKVFYNLGVRVMQIAFYQQNYLGAGCAESVDHGLTDNGRVTVKELNKLGILIDVSHCGDQTAIDVAEASEVPIAITHSTPATLVDLPRAKSDRTIKAIAEDGGVIGQVMLDFFNERKDRMGRPTLNDYIDNINYLVNLVGIDHVGLGFDLTPFWTKEVHDSFYVACPQIYSPHRFPIYEERYCKGFNGISNIIQVVEGLLRHGYSEDETKRILGGNWLRLFREVWK